MVCPRHLRNRPVVRQPASSLRALALRQRQFGFHVCKDDTLRNLSPPRAQPPSSPYQAAARGGQTPVRALASCNMNRSSTRARIHTLHPDSRESPSAVLLTSAFRPVLG